MYLKTKKTTLLRKVLNSHYARKITCKIDEPSLHTVSEINMLLAYIERYSIVNYIDPTQVPIAITNIISTLRDLLPIDRRIDIKIGTTPSFLSDLIYDSAYALKVQSIRPQPGVVKAADNVLTAFAPLRAPSRQNLKLSSSESEPSSGTTSLSEDSPRQLNICERSKTNELCKQSKDPPTETPKDGIAKNIKLVRHLDVPLTINENSPDDDGPPTPKKSKTEATSEATESC